MFTNFHRQPDSDGKQSYKCHKLHKDVKHLNIIISTTFWHDSMLSTHSENRFPIAAKQFLSSWRDLSTINHRLTPSVIYLSKRVNIRHSFVKVNGVTCEVFFTSNHRTDPLSKMSFIHCRASAQINGVLFVNASRRSEYGCRQTTRILAIFYLDTLRNTCSEISTSVDVINIPGSPTRARSCQATYRCAVKLLRSKQINCSRSFNPKSDSARSSMAVVATAAPSECDVDWPTWSRGPDVDARNIFILPEVW